MKNLSVEWAPDIAEFLIDHDRNLVKYAVVQSSVKRISSFS